MPRITWDDPGTRIFELGIDRGMLYLPQMAGVAWNGLIKVTESPSGSEAREYYIDGQKFLNISTAEEYESTVETFSAPREFARCMGMKSILPGLYIADQRRQVFGFSYRTMIADEVRGTTAGYKIHLVYNATAQISDFLNRTLDEQSSVNTYSWKITAIPVEVPLHRPSSHFIIDSRSISLILLQRIEDILYGTDLDSPRMISVQELLEILAAETSFAEGGLALAKMSVSGMINFTGPTELNGVITLKRMSIHGFGGAITELSGNVGLKKIRIAIFVDASTEGYSDMEGLVRMKKMRFSGSGIATSEASSLIHLKHLRISGLIRGISDITGHIRLNDMRIAATGKGTETLRAARLIGFDVARGTWQAAENTIGPGQLHRLFYNASNPLPATFSGDGTPSNIVIVMSYKVMNTNIASWIASIPDNRPEVWIIYHHEPENEMTASAFQTEFKNQADLVHAQGDPRVKFVYSAMAYQYRASQNPSAHNGDYARGLGNGWADIFGVDVYQGGAGNGAPNWNWSANGLADFEDFQSWLDVVTDVSIVGTLRPLAITEYGVDDPVGNTIRRQRIDLDRAYLIDAFHGANAVSPYPLQMWAYWWLSIDMNASKFTDAETIALWKSIESGIGTERSEATANVRLNKMRLSGSGSSSLTEHPFRIGGGNLPTGQTVRSLPVSHETGEGDTIVITCVGNSTLFYPTAASDSKDNVYVLDRSSIADTPWQVTFRSPGSTGGSSGGHTAALSPSDVIYITQNSTYGILGVIAIGLPASLAGTYDIIPASITSGESITPTATATPGSDDDIALALFSTGVTGGSPSQNSPFTGLGVEQSSGGPYCSAEYRELGSGTSGNSQSATETMTISTHWKGILYLFRKFAAQESSASGTIRLEKMRVSGSGEAASLPSDLGFTVLVASDEFSQAAAPWGDSTLSTKLSGWVAKTHTSGSGTHYNSWNEVQLTGSYLQLRCRYDGATWQGAFLEASGKAGFLPDYFIECRAKADSAAYGFVYAAGWDWSKPNGTVAGNEVDYGEMLGRYATTLIQTVQGITSGLSKNASVDSITGWHVYSAAVYSSLGKTDFYTDGVLTNTTTDSEMSSHGGVRRDVESDICISIWEGGSWAGNPSVSDSPQTMSVDWVRVWRKP